MNIGARGNWFLMFAIFIVGFAVMAGAVSWVGSDVTYYIDEGTDYYHNLSDNITGFNDDITFSIDTAVDNKINRTNESGSFLVSPDEVSDWIFVENSSTGNLTINATYDNQTGFFIIPIQAVNDSNGGEGAITNFEFQINATNDIPTFITTTFGHNWSSGSPTNYSVTFNDEENHYPLNFTLAQINCTHAEWTGKADDTECEIFTVTNTSNSSVEIGTTFDNDNVGTYWFNLTAIEAVHSCPHDYCDASTYETNFTVSQNVKFEIQSSLVINVSNCTDQVVMEDTEFNCTVNITVQGETDSLDMYTNAFYTNYPNTALAQSDNHSWFYSNTTDSATDFILQVPISITPDKKWVGNWTINFTADDNIVEPVTAGIELYVNFTESNVSLNSITDVDVYENTSFAVTGFDNDLLIRDLDLREQMTYDSNTSWVTFEDANPTPTYFVNYTTANVSVDFDYVLADGGAGNYSVLINVTDNSGSVASRIFNITIFDESAPEWDSALSDPVSLLLTEDVEFTYNVSLNVSDADGDNITFYYENVSEEFCSLTSSNFNSTSGIINFIPVDCDVGYHNVTIIASDGNLNSSKQFNFTVVNVLDTPIPSVASTVSAPEGSLKSITLNVQDDDFLIPEGQTVYTESLTVALTFTNLTTPTTPISFGFDFIIMATNNTAQYSADFTPDGVNVGEYNVTVNVSGAGGEYNATYFFLNITAQNDAPVLYPIANQTYTINDVFSLDINATDEEDDPLNKILNYTISNLTANGDFVTINVTSGEINVSLNSTYAGVWEYNVSVNDSSNSLDWQVFNLTVYGAPNITAPLDSNEFSWVEGTSTGDIDFEVSYAVNRTDLTYKFYLDRIIYSNTTAFNYTELINETDLRNNTNYTWTDDANYTWSFVPNYTDETYDMLKNLTLVVYNPSYPELNSSVNWKVNISYVNQNISFKSDTSIPDKGPISAGSSIDINMSDYFEDADYWDNKYSQTVSFSINTISGTGVISAYSSESAWIYTLTSPTAVTEIITISAFEYNDTGDIIGNATSDRFTVEFIPQTVVAVPTPSSGGGSTTKLKHFSLKLIAPQDVIVSEMGFIDIPFVVQNNGQIDLRGISLNSYVRFNDAFSDDVKISLGDNYIEELKFGQSENFTMRISANTQRAGKYKATILANVTSPKFSDFADFFIEIKKANESEAEQLLIFTDKFIAENPECLEFTELFKEAEVSFSLGEYSNSVRLAREVVEACEDAIESNEQIRYKVEGFVQDNFYYISFATLVIFFVGFVFYVYKRVRFNKSGIDEYV
jgi:hypothetical protein